MVKTKSQIGMKIRMMSKFDKTGEIGAEKAMDKAANTTGNLNQHKDWKISRLNDALDLINIHQKANATDAKNKISFENSMKSLKLIDRKVNQVQKILKKSKSTKQFKNNDDE